MIVYSGSLEPHLLIVIYIKVNVLLAENIMQEKVKLNLHTLIYSGYIGGQIKNFHILKWKMQK